MRIFIYSELNLLLLKNTLKKHFDQNTEVNFIQINALSWEDSINDLEKREFTQKDIVVFYFSRSHLLQNLEIQNPEIIPCSEESIKKVYENAHKNIKKINGLGLETIFINPEKRLITYQDHFCHQNLKKVSRY